MGTSTFVAVFIQLWWSLQDLHPHISHGAYFPVLDCQAIFLVFSWCQLYISIINSTIYDPERTDDTVFRYFEQFDELEQLVH